VLAAFDVAQLKDPLILFGFAGQAVFMARFLVQWYASEKRGRSHVPIAFWWLSFAGGCSLLLYAYLRSDPVIFFAQTLGLPVYARNLWLIYARRMRSAARRRRNNVPAVETALLSDGQSPIPTPVALDAGRE
jgi:lipid-A-disaccharide synthase-like uncharacterized protein